MLFSITCIADSLEFDFYVVKKETFKEVIEHIKEEYNQTDEDLDLEDSEIEEDRDSMYIDGNEYHFKILKISNSNEEMKNEIKEILNSNDEIKIAFLYSCLYEF